jgi:hypothetical protein
VTTQVVVTDFSDFHLPILAITMGSFVNKPQNIVYLIEDVMSIKQDRDGGRRVPDRTWKLTFAILTGAYLAFYSPKDDARDKLMTGVIRSSDRNQVSASIIDLASKLIKPVLVIPFSLDMQVQMIHYKTIVKFNSRPNVLRVSIGSTEEKCTIYYLKPPNMVFAWYKAFQDALFRFRKFQDLCYSNTLRSELPIDENDTIALTSPVIPPPPLNTLSLQFDDTEVGKTPWATPRANPTLRIIQVKDRLFMMRSSSISSNSSSSSASLESCILVQDPGSSPTMLEPISPGCKINRFGSPNLVTPIQGQGPIDILPDNTWMTYYRKKKNKISSDE